MFESGVTINVVRAEARYTVEVGEGGAARVLVDGREACLGQWDGLALRCTCSNLSEEVRSSLGTEVGLAISSMVSYLHAA